MEVHNLGARTGWIIHAKPRTLFTCGNKGCPLYWKLLGSWARSGRVEQMMMMMIIIIIIISMYRDTTNVEPEMYDCSSNWSYWNSNEKLKEKFGNCTRKTFDRFTTKDSYTWNITHNTESTAV